MVIVIHLDGLIPDPCANRNQDDSNKTDSIEVGIHETSGITNQQNHLEQPLTTSNCVDLNTAHHNGKHHVTGILDIGGTKISPT